MKYLKTTWRKLTARLAKLWSCRKAHESEAGGWTTNGQASSCVEKDKKNVGDPVATRCAICKVAPTKNALGCPVG